MTFQDSAAVRSASLAGIGMMLIGIFFFALNDAMGKFLIATFSVGQILLIRSAAGLVDAAAVHLARGLGAVSLRAAAVACKFWRAVFLDLRGRGVLLGAGLYVARRRDDVLSRRPDLCDGDVAVLLGEQVGWRRWAAVGAGFIGVMIALNPTGATLTPAAFVAIAGSLAFSILDDLHAAGARHARIPC